MAILEVVSSDEAGCVANVRAMIFAGAPLPEPYIPE
jgi:hypothetical protein